MASMKEITCKCGCGRKRMVRTADVKRGWGRFYSKRCKAVAQTRRMGCERHVYRHDEAEDVHPFSDDAHMQAGEY